jgi:hypothetical protein
MEPEPRQNWGYVCDVHAPRADPRYVRTSPQEFIGRYVKCAFRTVAEPVQHEHMWVEVMSVTPEGHLCGRLDNDPVYDVGVVCDDTVLVRLEAIEAVLPPLS